MHIPVTTLPKLQIVADSPSFTPWLPLGVTITGGALPAAYNLVIGYMLKITSKANDAWTTPSTVLFSLGVIQPETKVFLTLPFSNYDVNLVFYTLADSRLIDMGTLTISPNGAGDC